jgi:hypothetical protein
MAFFGQWSGNGPVSYYYPTMLQGAGINNNHTRLLYNGMQNVVSFGGAVFGAIGKKLPVQTKCSLSRSIPKTSRLTHKGQFSVLGYALRATTGDPLSIKRRLY